MALEEEMIEESKQEVILSAQDSHLLPVYFKLEQMRVLLVGAGRDGLLELKAILQKVPATKIHVVAMAISEEVKALAIQYPTILLSERKYQTEDLDHIEVLFLATNNSDTDSCIWDEAKEKNILVHVAASPELSDFYLNSFAPTSHLEASIARAVNYPVRKRKKIKNLLSRVWVEGEEVEKGNRWKKIAAYSVTAFALMLIGHLIFSYFPLREIKDTSIGWYLSLDKNFPWMVLAGFLAQLVDGALGMGYGLTSATILLSTGINPAAISGSIHTAEMFASGASGYSHYKFGNVNKKLFKILLIPGVIGAIAGAILLVFLGEKYSDYIRPILASYTLFLGLKILLNAFRKPSPQKKFKHYGPLAGLGGFLDSFGGGGWGPIVTTTLITKGRSPRFVIGTVSLTEFFVTIASAFTFFTLLGVSHWQTILALIIGGFIAAPIAARLAGKLPRKASFILLGLLVIVWSLKILSKLI
jgi:siroheme synthase-like protein